MADRTIRIRVIAAADPSLRGVFRPLEQEAERVYQKLGRQAKRTASDQERAAKAGAAAQEKAQGSPYRQSGRAYERDEKDFERAEKRKTQIAMREQAIRARIRDATFRKMQSDEERSERQAQVAGVQRRRGIVTGVRGFTGSVVRDVGGGARAVMGGVGEIARGAGIDASMGGLTTKVMSAESAAMRATLSGKAGQKVTGADVQETMAAVRTAGDSTATSYTEMATALENFTSKSSDLGEGKRVLADLGRIAKATGVDIAELASGAGAISQSMTGYGTSADEAERKAQDLLNITRLLAKQGTMGSVEIKDLATYMPRLSASAGKFAGDYTENIGQLGAVAQMAMKGGRSTAAEATNSAQALARDLTKRSNLKYLDEAGINPFADKGRTKLRSVSSIIEDVYAKTGGDQAKISSLFRNEMSRSAINAFADTYGEAGGGEAGLQAIRNEFKRFTATFSASDVSNAADVAIGSKAGQAQQMQNRFETAWASALEKIAPAMERLAPNIGKVADGFASLVGWLAENPGKAVGLALTASIAKAGLGAIVGNALTNAIHGGGPGGPGAGPGGGLGLANSLMTGLTIAAAAVTITAAGVTLIDEAFKEKEKAADEKRKKENKSAEDATNLLTSTDAATKAEALAGLTARRAEIEKQLEAAGQIDQMPDQFRATSGLLNYATAGEYGTSFDMQDTVRGAYENRGDLRDELATIDQKINEFKSRAVADTMFGAAPLGGPGASLDSQPSAGFNLVNPLARTSFSDAPVAKTDEGVKSSVDALAAAIKGGIRVNNLGDIKIPAPDPSRTGPDAVR